MATPKLRRLVPVAVIAAALQSFAPASAQDDSSRMREMMECDSIKSETTRLTCYDSVVRRGRAALGGNSAGVLPGVPAAQARRPQQAFGLTPKIDPARNSGPAPIEEINAKVASATDRGAGRWRITFVDGAKWDFTEGQHNFQPPERGDEVRIRKAALGGFLMYVGKQPSVRVTRIS